MDDNSTLIESLLQRTMEYIKTSYELVRLKTIDKVSDVISSLLPNLFVVILILTFLLFFNIGIAFWVGYLLEKPFLGFFIVSGFYLLTALILYLFLYKRIKRSFYNFIIKRMTKK
jgi:hypothetical protein